MIRPMVASAMRLPFTVAPRSTVRRAATTLFSHQYRSLSTAQSVPKSSLPTSSERPTLLKRPTGIKAIDLAQYTPSEVAKRLPTFSDADWSQYLSLIANYRISSGKLLPYKAEEMKSVDQIKSSLFDWLANQKDNVKPIDYFNLLRSLDVFDEYTRLTKRRAKAKGVQQEEKLSSSAHEDIFQWFMKNYDKLDRHAFFQILDRKTLHVMLYDILGTESKEDVLKVFAYGVELAGKDAEIVNILHLLHTIEIYSGFYSDSRFSENSQRLLAALTTKNLPIDGYDLMHSLQFVSSQKNVTGYLSPRAVFHRHAKNTAAWNWLRNSIDLVFANDDYEDMRPMAAVAAIRAYKWKAIDYSADDVNKYLSLAAEPFLSNPATYFSPAKNEAFIASKRAALSYLILALRSAAISDLPESTEISVRLDDVYWNRFFDVVEMEAPKLGERAPLLRDLRRLKIFQRLSKEELRYLSDPFSQGRDARLKELLKQKYHLSSQDAGESR